MFGCQIRIRIAAVFGCRIRIAAVCTGVTILNLGVTKVAVFTGVTSSNIGVTNVTVCMYWGDHFEHWGDQL